MAVVVLDLSAACVCKRQPCLLKQCSAGTTVYSIDVTTLCDYTFRPVGLRSVRGFPFKHKGLLSTSMQGSVNLPFRRFTMSRACLTWSSLQVRPHFLRVLRCSISQSERNPCAVVPSCATLKALVLCEAQHGIPSHLSYLLVAAVLKPYSYDMKEQLSLRLLTTSTLYIPLFTFTARHHGSHLEKNAMVSGQHSHSASLPERRGNRQHPQDEMHEENIATASGRRRTGKL